MRRKDRNRKSRHLIRHQPAGTTSETQATEVEVEVATEEATPCLEFTPSMPATNTSSFITEIGGTGQNLRSRAADRRNRDTLFAFLIFLSMTCLIVLGSK